MNLDHYIQGIRKGRDINYLEREAMCDPFLSDALEGYDQVKGEHWLRINAMKKQIIQQTRPKKNLLLYWGIAAAILGIIGPGIYFLRDKLPHATNNYFTKLPETKSNTNTIAIVPEPVLKEIPDSIPSDSLQRSSVQLDSLQISDSFFNKNEPFFAISMSSFVTESLTDSLLGPLILKKSTEEKPEEKPVQSETALPGPKPAVGYKEYESYLRREMIRPVEDDCEGVKGKVVLTFSINGNGRPYDISVTKSLCSSADAEAIRLLREGPGWISGDKNAQVEVRF
jgi:hypothetical protein